MLLAEHTAVKQMQADLDAGLKEELKGIEEYATAYTLADAIRDGAKYTEQLHGGWYNATEACALSAAAMAIEARGLSK